jgi:hypothetical protein
MVPERLVANWDESPEWIPGSCRGRRGVSVPGDPFDVRIWEDCVDTGVKSQLGKQVPQRIHTLVLLIPGRDATLAKGVPVAPRTSISRACKPRTGVLSLVHRVWARSVL